MNKWIPIDEGTLEDHHYYLIAHKDYGTPMKAKFHRECFGDRFEFFTYSGPQYECSLDGKITHYMELPSLPWDDESQ